MFPNLNLGRVFGIPLKVHWTFWLLPAYVVLTRTSQLPIGFLLAVIFAIFGCVILHELGHALAARFYGIRTRDITLYPIGGVASLARISEKPVEELVIAVAGPAVNVVLAGLLILVTAFLGALVPDLLAGTLLANFLWNLVVANIVMIVFNMIPAFPLDGGRVFRALLAMFVPYVQATRVAVYGGAVLTLVLLAVVSFVWPELVSAFTLVIVFFLISAGQAELAMVQQRAQMRAMHAPSAFVSQTMPAWLQPSVTVYVLDPQTGQWVRQERH